MGNFNSMQTFPSSPGNRDPLQTDMNDVTTNGLLKKSASSPPERHSPKTTVKDVINHVKSMPNNSINNALYGLLVNKNSILDNMEGHHQHQQQRNSTHTTNRETPPETSNKRPMNHHHHAADRESQCSSSNTSSTTLTSTTSVSSTRDHETIRNRTLDTPGSRKSSEESLKDLHSNTTIIAAGDSQKQDVVDDNSVVHRQAPVPPKIASITSSVPFNPKKRFIQRYEDPEPTASAEVAAELSKEEATTAAAVASTIATSTTAQSSSNNKSHHQASTATAKPTAIMISPNSRVAVPPPETGKQQESTVSMRIFLDEMMAQMVRTPLNELEMPKSPTATTAKEVPVQKRTMTQYDLIQQKIRQMLQDEDCGGGNAAAIQQQQHLPKLPPPPLEEEEMVTQNAAAITPLTLISAQIEAVMRQQPIEDGVGGVVGKPEETTQSPHHHHRSHHRHLVSSPQDNSSSHSNGKEPPGKNNSGSGVLVHGYPQLRSHLLGSITKGTPRSKPPMDEALLAEKRAPKDTVYSIITNEIKQRVFSKEATDNSNNCGNSGSTPSSTDTRRNTWSFPNRAAAAAAAAATTVVPPPLERKILGNSPHRPIVIDPSPLGGAAAHAHHQQHHLLLSPQTSTTGLERPASYHGGSNQGTLLDGGGKPGSPSMNRRPSFSKNPLRDAYFGKRDNVGKFRLEGASPNRHVNTPHEDMRLRAHTVSSLRPPDMSSPPQQQQQSVGRLIPSPIQHPHQHPSPQQPPPHHQHHRYTPYPTSSSKSEQHFPIRAGSVDNKQSQSTISLGKKFPSPYGGHHMIGREVTNHQGQGQHTPLPSPRSIPPQQQHPSEAGRRSHGVYEKQGHPQHHQHSTHHAGEELGQKNVVFQQGPSDAIRTSQPVFCGGSITAGTPRSAGPLLLEKQRELLTEAYEIQSRMSPPRHQQHQATPHQQQAGRVVRPPSKHEFEKDSREGHLPSHLHPSPAPYLHSPHATQTGSAHTTPPVSQSGVLYQFEPGHIPKPSISIGPAAMTAVPPPLMPLKDVAASMVRESVLGAHGIKPDIQYRARSRSPLGLDRARGFEVEPNNRQPRGGDLPLDLSSRKEAAEPNMRGLVTSAAATHHPSPSSPPLAPAGIPPHHHHSFGPGPKARPDFGPVGGSGGLPIDSSIYQEEWLKSYILPLNDKPRFAERSQTLRNDPSEPQKPNVIIPTSHDITISKPSEVARRLPAAAALDINHLTQPTADYLVATAQMAYSEAAAAAAAAGPYGLIYGPMAFGLKPAGFVGVATAPTISEAPTFATTKQHVSQPIIKDNNTVQSSIMHIEPSPNNNKQTSSNSSSNTTNSNSGNRPETKMRSLGPNLLGDHPADDVLSLDCSLCRANYGNVHSFIRHFHRDHSKEGEPQRHHVGIRSIMKAKHDKEVEEGRSGGCEGETTRLRKPSLENIIAAAAGTTNKDSANIPTRKDQVMNCLYCNQEFPTRDWGLFRKHMRSHDPHQSPSDLAAPPLPQQHHQQNQHPLFRCSECRLEFRDAEEHQFHASLCHRNDRGCMCRVCHGGESFAGLDAMYRHIHTVHEGLGRVEVEYCCLDCGKSYSSERELYSHWHQTHRYFHDRASSSPGPNITLAVRTRVRDQGVATMSPPAATSSTVHRATPDTTCKEGSDERETSNKVTKDQDQALSAVSRYSSGGPLLPSKGSTIQEKMLQHQQQQPQSKSKALSYLEFLEQKVEEEHHKQEDSGVSNAIKGAGTGTTTIIPRTDETFVNRTTTTTSQVGRNIFNKRHHEEEQRQQQPEVVVGSKVPRLDIDAPAADFAQRREMATVDSKITEIITNTLAEKKLGGGVGTLPVIGSSGDSGGSVTLDKDREETSLNIQNENRVMRALMTTFLKEDVGRILSVLQEQQGDAVRGGGTKHQQQLMLPIGTTDPLLLAAAAAAHHQQQQNQLQQQLLQQQATNRSDITDSDIIDATVLAGISGGGEATAPPKVILHHPPIETSNTDKQNSLDDDDDPSNGSCPPKLESLLLVENSSNSSLVHARSPVSDGGGIVIKNGVITGQISSDTDETEASMPVLEAEKPTATDHLVGGELKEEETLYHEDDNKGSSTASAVYSGTNDCHLSSEYGEDQVASSSLEAAVKEALKGEQSPPPKSPKKRIVLERVDSFEEPPLVIDMDNDGEDEDGEGSVRNDSASDGEEDIE